MFCFFFNDVWLAEILYKYFSKMIGISRSSLVVQSFQYSASNCWLNISPKATLHSNVSMNDTVGGAVNRTGTAAASTTLGPIYVEIVGIV